MEGAEGNPKGKGTLVVGMDTLGTSLVEPRARQAQQELLVGVDSLGTPLVEPQARQELPQQLVGRDILDTPLVEPQARHELPQAQQELLQEELPQARHHELPQEEQQEDTPMEGMDNQMETDIGLLVRQEPRARQQQLEPQARQQREDGMVDTESLGAPMVARQVPQARRQEPQAQQLPLEAMSLMVA